MPRPISPSGRPGMNRVKSSSGVEFQSSAGATKVGSQAPRNRLQNVKLCQPPNAGVGQMRNGGAGRVRSKRRSSVMPAMRPAAKTNWVTSKVIMVHGVKTRFVLQICDRTLNVLCRLMQDAERSVSTDDCHRGETFAAISARVAQRHTGENRYPDSSIERRALDSGLRRNDGIRQI